MPFVFSDIKKAIKVADRAKPAKDGYCGCAFGDCIRTKNKSTNKDWYEPNEPELERNGLPLDYYLKS